MVIKAVIFDIGGVVLRSPMLAIANYEKEHGIPPNYINCVIAKQGAYGAFQKFERGEIALFPFYEAFSRELSSPNGVIWYREFCERRGLKCPSFPAVVKVDGRELFGRMMRESNVYDDLVVEAILRIRGAILPHHTALPASDATHLRSASGRYRIIALTNNFTKSEDTISTGAPSGTDFSFQKELEFLGWQEGPTPSKLRALFDDFCDSSTLGLRKPDPAFYVLACKRNNIRPDEAVFLDDIGYNLKAAQKLGMQTIQVTINGSLPALERLGQKLKLDLISGKNESAQAIGAKL